MRIHCQGLRDRRKAAADEHRAAGGKKHIFANRSAPRRHSERIGPRGRFNIRDFAFNRSLANVHSIILHQTTFFCNPNKPEHVLSPDIAEDSNIHDNFRMDKVRAHFVVLKNGIIVYTHDIEYRLNSVSNQHGIDIEFEGSYSTGPRPMGERLSVSAIKAGRRLVQALKQQLPSIRHIHPHGQVQESPGKKYVCCGPDIWMNVGEWAVNHLRLICDNTTNFPNHHDAFSPSSNRKHGGQRNPAYDKGIIGT